MSLVRAIPVILLGLLASATVRGATTLDDARRAATEAHAGVEALRQEQTALRQQLNATGDRIARLKKPGRRVIGNAALEAELRRSQELSASLGGLATRISAAETQAQARDVALVEALAAELDALRAQADATGDRTRRAELYARMRTLRAERDTRRGALPASTVPSMREAQGDDPEDLLEQADAFRDAEDKLRARVGLLETRIAEVRAERELDRRMREFAEDEAIFDEQDRRWDRGTPQPRGAPEGQPSSDQVSGPPGAGPVSGDTVTPRSSGGPVAGTASPDMVGAAVTAPGATGPVDSLDALEAERARLRALADELAQKAHDAEQRAKRLE